MRQKDEFHKNPYLPPSTNPLPATLSRLERTAIQFYWKHREHPPTFMALAFGHFPNWATMLVLSLGVTILPFWVIKASIPKSLAVFMAGLMVGAVARDISYCRRVVRIWPFFKDILDWTKLAARLGEPEGRAQAADS